MAIRRFVCALGFGLLTSACGQTVCEEAFELRCACPGVGCEGSPSTCEGADETEAKCILALDDPCDSAAAFSCMP